MPAAAYASDRIACTDALAEPHGGIDGFVGRSKLAVIDNNHTSVDEWGGIGNLPGPSGSHLLAGASQQVNAAMSSKPICRRWIESVYDFWMTVLADRIDPLLGLDPRGARGDGGILCKNRWHAKSCEHC